MRVGEQRSVQRMILVAETGRLASIATLGPMIRPAANDEASVPGHGRYPALFRAFRKIVTVMCNRTKSPWSAKPRFPVALKPATGPAISCPSASGALGLHGLKAIYDTDSFSRNYGSLQVWCP